MVRRDAALLIGGYREQFDVAEDYDFWLRLSEVGDLANLPEFLYYWRVHTISKSALEGRALLEKYVLQARHMALQRYLSRQDYLGYAIPSRHQNTCSRVSALPRSMLSAVTLADWAMVFMSQHEFRMGNRLLFRAVLTRPFDHHSWSVVRKCYLSAATVRISVAMLFRMSKRAVAWVN